MTATVPTGHRQPGLRLFDAEALLARTGDDPAFVRELITLFAQFAAHNISCLKIAVGLGDDEQIRQLAHGMRGAAANIAAAGLAQLAEALEQAPDNASARAACRALDAMLDETLAHWRRSGWLADEIDAANGIDTSVTSLYQGGGGNAQVP